MSWLHKKLVGTRVLSVTTSGRPNTTRVYAHCMKEQDGYDVIRFPLFATARFFYVGVIFLFVGVSLHVINNYVRLCMSKF